MQVIEIVGLTARVTVTAMAASSFILTLILSTSLNLIWGLINALQIIVFMPMLNVYFPANAFSLTMKLLELAQFDLLPSDKLNSLVFDLKDL